LSRENYKYWCFFYELPQLLVEIYPSPWKGFLPLRARNFSCSGLRPPPNHYLDAFEMPRVAATSRMEITFCGRPGAAHSALPMRGPAPWEAKKMNYHAVKNEELLGEKKKGFRRTPIGQMRNA